MPVPRPPHQVLPDSVDVYTSGPSGWTVLHKSGLRCRVSAVPIRTAPGGQARAELQTLRRMVWEPEYVMPTRCQVLWKGERWNVVADSHFTATWPLSGAPIYRACDLVRAAGVGSVP